jgi:hypothetical protein
MLSGEIWIPADEEKYITFYDSETLQVNYLAPLPTLISKAVKAPIKNRPLIRRALKHFGERLRECIEKYGGDISQFEHE